MADEIKNEETQSEVQNEQVNEESNKKVYTEDDVKNLLSAKNHEKELRKNLQSELDELKAKFAKLNGEEAVEKFNQEKFNKLQQEFEQLKEKNDLLIQQAEDNDFKDELRKVKGLLPEAVDDVLNKAKQRGFKKVPEIGYLDSNGKTVEDLIKDLKSSNSYYFGLSSNKNVIPEALQTQIENAKKNGNTLGMLREAYNQINLREIK